MAYQWWMPGGIFGTDQGKEFLFGKEEQMQQAPLYTPQQQEFFNMMLQQGGEGMGQGWDYLMKIMGGDTSAFEAPLMREFQEQTIPGIAEQFASIDGQSSSAFGQALGSAGAGLQENLAMLREGLKMQALQQMQSMTGMGTGQQFENILRPGTSGFLDTFAQGAGQALGAYGTSFLPQPKTGG